MDECERRVNQERDDRIKYHDDHLNPIRKQLKGIQEGLVKEKKTRITNEKKVMQEIRDESKNMQDDIKKERTKFHSEGLPARFVLCVRMLTAP